MSILIRGQPPNGDADNATSADPGNLSDDSNGWWWSASAEGLKWGIVIGICIIFLLTLLGANLHAQRRMKKGLQPLPYHRWLVRRRQRAQYAPAFYGQRNGYTMDPYAAPPPPYNAEHDYVPPYAPPAEGSKFRMKEETTAVPMMGGPSQPPPVANPARPIYS